MTREEVYSCRKWCGLGGAQQDETQRRNFRCALPGFPESKWGDGSKSRRVYMGRLPIYGVPTEEEDVDILNGENPLRPLDGHNDGCPGAWTNCAFVRSLEKYERVIHEGGAIPSLVTSTDRLVIEALQFIEAERIRERIHTIESRHSVESNG